MRKKTSLRDLLLALSYARRELRAGVRGFYIFLACLALGTAAIAGVRSLSEGLIDSLHHDGRFILGGDIALRTVYQPATPEQLHFLNRKIGVVNTVMETRAMARAAEKSMLVELKAVDPFYPLYGKVEFADNTGKPLDKTPQDIILPPVDTKGELTDDWGAAVDRDVLTRLGLRVGDTITLGKKNFTIRAIITKEPDRVGTQTVMLAPRVLISSTVFAETGLSRQGVQVYYDHRILMPYVRTYKDMEEAMKKITDAFPNAEWRGRNCFNAAPRVERLILQVTQLLTLIGFATLLVGGVGVSNAVKSFLDSKRANIATLKCLGASGAFVTRTYLMMTLILAALGILIGLLTGALGALAAGHILTQELSLTNQTSIYPEVLALAGAFGFLVTLCFSLWPIGRAAQISPNDLFRDLVQPATGRPHLTIILWTLIASQALALIFILSSEDQRFATFFILGALLVFSVFLACAGAVRFILRHIRPPAWPEMRLALANLHRPGNVSTSVILSMGMSLTVLAAVALVQNNFSRLLSDDLAPQTPSFFFLDIEPAQKDAFSTLINSHAAAGDLAMTPSFRGRITAVNGKPAQKALVDKGEAWVVNSDRGFTWASKLPPHSEITAGQWWDENYQGSPLVSIATNVARAFNIGVGDSLTLNVYGVDVTAKVANVREIQWSSFAMNFAITFSPGLISQAPANLMATVSVAQEAEESLQSDIVRQFPNVTVVRVREAFETAQRFIGVIAQGARIGAATTLLAGALVLGGGIAAARRRHVYDAVILKVLGATRGRILGAFLIEYGILGIITALISCLFGTIAAFSMVTYIMNIPWHFSPSALVSVTVLSLVITLLAGFSGTWRALLQKPAIYLRNR